MSPIIVPEICPTCHQPSPWSETFRRLVHCQARGCENVRHRVRERAHRIAERADRGPNCDRCGQLKMKVTRTYTTLTDPVNYLICQHCKAATMREKLTGSRRVMPDPLPAIAATPDPESAVHPACYREWKDYVKAWDHLMSGRPWPKPAAREPVEEELR